jgi:hypothetical protein
LLSIYDITIAPVFLIIAIFALGGVKKNSLPALQAYFYPALATKIFGAIAFVLVYKFYYGGGDTFYYQLGANALCDAFYYNPAIYFKILFLKPLEYNWDTVRFTRFSYFKSTEEFSTVKIASLFAIIGFKTYMVSAWGFGLYCFLGMWKAFEAVCKLFPKPKYIFWIFVAFFLSPSSVFWGSALMKDTWTLAGVCFIFTAALNIAFFRQKIALWAAILILNAYMIYIIKPYILFFMLPALFIFLYISFQKSIKSVFVKILAVPFLLILFGLGGFLSINSLLSSNKLFSSEKAVMEKIEGFHVDHGRIAGGTTYSLGEVEYTRAGIVKKMPEALFVTLYRPFFWETRGSPVVLLSALESFIYFFFSVYALIKVRFYGFFSWLFQSPLFTFCVIFTIVMGASVGFVAINFGALARFKIPIMPFFGLAIVQLFYKLK